MNKKFLQPISLALLPVGILAHGAAAEDAQGLRATADGHALPVMRCAGPVSIAVDQPLTQQDLAPASGDFNIVPSFATTVTAAQRAVIQRAIDEWNAILQSRGVHPGTWTIPITYDNSHPSFLAQTFTTWSLQGGQLLSASMTFYTNYTWYVDPNPADDLEFDGPPPAGFDMLSVARHELGHAVGWVGTSRVNNLVSGAAFDPARLNIGMAPGDNAHADPVAHPGELMQPGMGPSTRTSIRLYPTAALVSRAYEQVIPMHFVDPAYTGTEVGTAWQPWRTFFTGATLTPANIPLLLAPTTHNTLQNFNHNIPRTIQSARGGATVLGVSLP